jgi:hypothetical protein
MKLYNQYLIIGLLNAICVLLSNSIFTVFLFGFTAIVFMFLSGIHALEDGKETSEKKGDAHET